MWPPYWFRERQSFLVQMKSKKESWVSMYLMKRHERMIQRKGNENFPFWHNLLKLGLVVLYRRALCVPLCMSVVQPHGGRRGQNYYSVDNILDFPSQTEEGRGLTIPSLLLLSAWERCFCLWRLKTYFVLFFIYSGSTLGGLLTVACYFFNHAEASVGQFQNILCKTVNYLLLNPIMLVTCKVKS